MEKTPEVGLKGKRLFLRARRIGARKIAQAVLKAREDVMKASFVQKRAAVVSKRGVEDAAAAVLTDPGDGEIPVCPHMARTHALQAFVVRVAGGGVVEIK
jgi:hypothetical protein